MEKTDKLSKREFEAVQLELAERMKDVIYSTAQRHAKKVVEWYGDDALNISSTTSYEIVYKIHFLAGDIQQIVARMRRKK